VNNIQEHQTDEKMKVKICHLNKRREKNDHHRTQVAETENKKPLYLERAPILFLAFQKPA
jgi:hypothetical protein